MSSLQVFSNLRVYREIAENAFHEMQTHLASQRTPRGDGGFILHHDPDRKSFKSGLIAIAFCSAYLDLLCRLSYIAKFGVSPDRDWDVKLVYENKLASLGVTDLATLSDCKTFREARNDVMHEKPVIMGGTNSSPRGTAQEAAGVGIRLISALADYFEVKRAHE